MFYDRLKSECEKKGYKIIPLVVECGGNKSSPGTWRKGASPNSDIVVKLADKLNVTTDYLLGRSDRVSINTGDVSNSVVGSVNSSVNVGEKLSDIEEEILKVCKNLDFRDKVDVLQYAYKKEEEEKTK